MSGHSKWASIKHEKGANDAKRGKLFTKLIREIIVSSRMGGADPDSNTRLRAALFKAKSANMPKDNIERAIKKGSGELEGEEYKEITYEAYGPGGVALLIGILTDNRNKAAAEIRKVLSKGGGNLGETGCVSYMFKRQGIIAFDAQKYTEDAILDVAIEAGAEDVAVDEDSIEVITSPEDFEQVLAALEEASFEHTLSEIAMVPDTRIELNVDKTRKALSLIENLEDNDDVQSVASNIEIPRGFVYN